ncbi:MAG: hypothetical protein RI957_672 [Verrucomicrobiota bacterium]|jgi:hypothetical protein
MNDISTLRGIAGSAIAHLANEIMVKKCDARRPVEKSKQNGWIRFHQRMLGRGDPEKN